MPETRCRKLPPDPLKVKRHTHPWVDTVKAQVLVARCENTVWVILEYHNLVGVLLDNIGEFGLSIPTIAAALVAREATIWFGAWIGARGRKLKARNAEALAEYEVALAEAQAKQA